MKGNVLGDIRAEQDTRMLEDAFWESSDYKTLLESYDRPEEGEQAKVLLRTDYQNIGQINLRLM